MLHDCPHCGISLKRRLIRSAPAPGERRFLPGKAVSLCPDCGGTLQHNPHPAERWQTWLVLALAGAFLLKDGMSSPQWAMVALIGCWVAFALVSIYVEQFHLRDWQRYRRPEASDAIPPESTRGNL
ncbi:hypothetical protein [Diaphorobacter caeni]|uniref:hypothetical protein n=1 Tax=Diaphorobacter caeni TaxID=2784387 RepID=UPI00188EAABD|nr:hypothetical protein [Diaphorobacter caeni]MBF5005492.1 hypothetical protein [Diaphorobacter caeni]